ncbi:4'-phosphopantetheinyl transferase family protein [Gulosibacter bifidus]|uniref:4'-phosphopantetheinyl transferase family protein n=1 Tax=Gulosibacter bifidus TaxID=272239 RepID=A0ABW5RF58_9MICO|nr:4'-phosphopantetheinyl transferase superfamily protein [Gulosibacter bifidus]
MTSRPQQLRVDVHVAILVGGNVDADAALRTLVTRISGRDPGHPTRSCRSCGSSNHGRPVFRTPTHEPTTCHRRRTHHYVSISRTRDRDVTALAYCPTHPVGIDIETVNAAAFDGFDAVALHPYEHCENDRERTQLWVRKEALLKAHGTGLATDPRRIQLAATGEIIAGPLGTVTDLDLPASAPGIECQAAIAVTLPHADVHCHVWQLPNR